MFKVLSKYELAWQLWLAYLRITTLIKNLNSSKTYSLLLVLKVMQVKIIASH